MLREYLKAALHQARYEIIAESGNFYGEIPGFQGVYSSARTLEACREELEEVLEEWVLFRISRNLPLPRAGEIDLAIKEVA